MNIPKYENIKEYRKQKKISQKELGRRVGLSQAMIANIECGRRVCSGDIMVAIARELEVEVSVLKSEQPVYMKLVNNCKLLTESQLNSLNNIAEYFIKTGKTVTP